MNQAHVVIGSNFGDEGKGLMTDFFTRQFGGEGVLVARFNGGAQAGHTVVDPDGRRHVFSHFGAGSFAGADTLLTRHFIANPILFRKEREELREKGVAPKVVVDPRALLTTPYDMLINEMIETARGASRHGSVGLGINETVTRSEHNSFHLPISLAVTDLSLVEARLRMIRDLWVPERVVALGIEAEFEKRKDLLTSDLLIENWLILLEDFLLGVEVLRDVDTLRDYENVVFEGAQGLLLDQERGTFPHVTRSNTGIKNVVEILRELPPIHLGVTYATRAYMTRHGAGPLAGELPGKPFPGVYDLTNVPHEFQGALRYALLDVDSLRERVFVDYADSGELGSAYPIEMSLAVTCLDQLPDHSKWTRGGSVAQGSRDDLVEAVRSVFSTDVYTSSGPSATDVRLSIPV